MKTAKKLLSVLLVAGLLLSMFVLPSAAADKLDTRLIFTAEDGSALTGTIAKDTVILAKWVADNDVEVTAVQATLAVNSNKLQAVNTGTERKPKYAKSDLEDIIPTTNYVTDGVTEANTALLKASFASDYPALWETGTSLLCFTLKVVSDGGISVGELPLYVKFMAQNSELNQTIYGIESCRSFIKGSEVFDVVFNVCPYGAASQKTGEDGLIYNTTAAADVKDKLSANAYDASGAPLGSVTVAGVYTDAAAKTALTDADLLGAAFEATAATASLDVYVKTTDGIILPVTLAITDSVKEIYVAAQPTKLEYEAFETLSADGIGVKAKCFSGRETDVTGFTVKFNGAEVTAATTVTVADSGKTLTVEYEGKTAATNAITVTPFTITNKNAAQYLDYTAPASLEYTGSAIAATVAPKSAYADGMTGAITLSYQITPPEASASPAAEAVNVGTYQVYADIAAGGDFAAVSGIALEAWQFTITPKALEGATVTAKDEPVGGFIYTGEAIEPEIEVTVNGTTVSSSDYEVTYPADATNVGEKTVTVTFKNNYGGSASGTYRIAAKEVEAELDTVTGKTYDGSTDATATLKIKNADTEVYGGDTLTVSGTAVWTSANAGTATLNVTGITLGGASAGNYTLKATEISGATAPGGAKIAKAAAPAGIKLERSIYYKLTTPQTINWTDFSGWPGDPGNAAIKENSASDVSGDAKDAISAVTAGSFTLAALEDTALVDKTATWTVQLESDNFETATATVTVTLINKTPVTFLVNGAEVPADGLTAEYTGSAIAPVVTLKGLTMVEGGLKATWSKGGEALSAAPKDVGEYLLKLSYDDSVPNGENNAIPGYHGDIEIPVVIRPKSIKVTWTDTELTYTGKAQKPTAVAGEGVVSGDTVNLSVSGEQTDAGTYSAEAAIEGNDNYTIADTEATKTAEFTIGEAALTVTAKAKTVTYGDAPANDGVEYSGFVNGETEAVLGGSLDYDYSYAQYGDAGSYTITPKGLTAANYEISYAAGTLTVEKKVVGIDWTNLEFDYDGDAHTPTATATGLVNGDACALTVTGSGTDAGDYTATVTGLGNANYQLPADGLEKAFKVNKAAVEDKTAEGAAKYGNSGTVALADLIEAGGTVTVAGVVNADANNKAIDDESTVTFSEGVLSFTLTNNVEAVGKTATVTLDVKNATNHQDYQITVTVTVSDKYAQNLSFAEEELEKTYGDADFTVTVSGAVEGSTVTYASGDETVATVDETGTVHILKVGTAVITAEASATEDYAVGTASYTLNVGKATVTVTALSRTIEMGVTVPDLSEPVKGRDYTVTGLVGSDELSGTVAMAYDGEVNNNQIGRYTITISGGAVPNENYNSEIVYEDGALNVVDSSVPVKSITLNKSILSLEVGASETLSFIIDPSDASVQVINWSSSDTSVVTVDSDGYVRALKEGKATVKVTAVGTGYSAQCEVTVAKKGSGSEPAPDTGKEEIVVKPEVTDGKGTAEVPDQDIKDALENKEDVETLNIVVDTEGAKEVETKLSGDALNKIAEAGADLQIDTELATVNIGADTVQALADQGREVAVTVTVNENGNVSVFLGDNAAAQEETVKIALPEIKGGEVLAVVKPDGTEEIVKKSVTEDGKIYADIPVGTEVKLVDNSKTYSDVPANAWYKSYVDFVTSHELFQGTDKGFEGNLPMSRAMLATVLCRLENGKASGKSILSDVPEDAWYADAVAWVVETGIMIGTDVGFEPNANVTREQIATTLYRYAQYLGLDVSGRSSLAAFPDGDKTAGWAKDAMSWAVSVGLFQGDDTGALNPKDNATRAQVAKLFRSMVELIVK